MKSLNCNAIFTDNISISLTIPFCFDLTSHSPFDLLEASYTYFTNNPCPLCQKVHPVKFLCFVQRISFKNNVTVIKIICLNNLNSNKTNNTKLQYTITLLPAFIQPYARTSTQQIIEANEGYINNQVTSQQEAAMLMGRENPASFKRYFTRVNERIDNWIINLLKKISEITLINNLKWSLQVKNSILEKWEYFCKLTEKYIDEIDKLNTGLLILKENKLPFIMAVLCPGIKSLGP